MVGFQIETGSKKRLLNADASMLRGIIDCLGGGQLKFIDEDVIGNPVITKKPDKLFKRLGNIPKFGILHIEAAAEFTLHYSKGS